MPYKIECDRCERTMPVGYVMGQVSSPPDGWSVLTFSDNPVPKRQYFLCGECVTWLHRQIKEGVARPA